MSRPLPIGIRNFTSACSSAKPESLFVLVPPSLGVAEVQTGVTEVTRVFTIDGVDAETGGPLVLVGKGLFQGDLHGVDVKGVVAGVELTQRGVRVGRTRAGVLTAGTVLAAPANW